MDLVARVAAGDNAVLWDADVKEDAPDNGIQMTLSRGLPPLVFSVYMEWFTKRECFKARQAAVGDWADLPLEDHVPGLVTNLSPWRDWWNDYTQTIVRLKMSDRQ